MGTPLDSLDAVAEAVRAWRAGDTSSFDAALEVRPEPGEDPARVFDLALAQADMLIHLGRGKEAYQRLREVDPSTLSPDHKVQHAWTLARVASHLGAWELSSSLRAARASGAPSDDFLRDEAQQFTSQVVQEQPLSPSREGYIRALIGVFDGETSTDAAGATLAHDLQVVSAQRDDAEGREHTAYNHLAALTTLALHRGDTINMLTLARGTLQKAFERRDGPRVRVAGFLVARAANESNQPRELFATLPTIKQMLEVIGDEDVEAFCGSLANWVLPDDT